MPTPLFEEPLFITHVWRLQVLAMIMSSELCGRLPYVSTCVYVMSTYDVTHMIRCSRLSPFLTGRAWGLIILTDSCVWVSHYGYTCTHGRNLHLSEGRHEAGDLPVVLAVHLCPVINQQTDHIKVATWRTCSKKLSTSVWPSKHSLNRGVYFLRDYTASAEADSSMLHLLFLETSNRYRTLFVLKIFQALHWPFFP